MTHQSLKTTDVLKRMEGGGGVSFLKTGKDSSEHKELGVSFHHRANTHSESVLQMQISYENAIYF